jgi:hypothetical protein
MLAVMSVVEEDLGGVVGLDAFEDMGDEVLAGSSNYTASQ